MDFRPPPRTSPRPRLRTSVALLAATGLLVGGASGCSSGTSSPPIKTVSTTTQGQAQGSSGAADRAALAPYYAQKLTWRQCGVPGFECATMKAPLDYAKPGSGSGGSGDIKLAVARVKATGPGKRNGSLLVNPGGPGGSAIGYLQAYAGLGYPAPVRARYDMVAVDPRGVARSEPVQCLTGKEMDAHTQVDQTPDNAAEVAALSAAYEKFSAGCKKRSARILPHVSTVEAARDMDLLREILGDEKLQYVGASYGTFLGATYAELFPDRTGRLVLDGAMDPSLPSRDLNRDQTAGFQTAVQSFAADCVKQRDCPLGTGTPAQAATRLKALLTALDAKPAPTKDKNRPLGEALATMGAIAAMYDEGAWPRLRAGLKAAQRGDGNGLLALADSYYERGPNGEYANLMYANTAVNCLDLPPAFATAADVETALPSFEKASPVFGAGLAWASLNCASWPVPATGKPHRIEAPGAAPIVVVGTTRDPATPYKWAKSLAAQLATGTLLTYDGDGHTAYGRGSDCIDTAINAYLLEGTPPQDGKQCS
ncbi:alpha/beta hydrolase [Streptomyces candidus]|uniref:Pimeloyl-ACP methyl ester carboxylesterase n=1 Tax=Streptomyces candidus TaxID=67283 RepID=A0A7X0HI92_9ACTN|nr:alpha/beta hydrolase [Streptomyces candidus]MBB6438050.1 pimeloyl-ACP methyl ester carboxylesterase [Streptomyces candidus]